MLLFLYYDFYVYPLIYNKFYEAVGSSDYTVSNDVTISEQSIEKIRKEVAVD
jgi:hypothetical protein